VSVDFEDGRTSESQDGQHVTFRSTNLEARDIRTDVTASSSNGRVTVSGG
jgi:hypothetical protein